MSDLEQRPEPDSPDPHQGTPPPSSSDPWQIWFSRAIQVTGLGIMVFETLGRKAERPWLMLFATGMMLGGIGLQLILRWVAGRMPG